MSRPLDHLATWPQLFAEQWERLGGKARVVSSYGDALAYLLEVVRTRAARKVCGWDDPVLREAGVERWLAGAGAQYQTPATGLTREYCGECDLGVTSADLAIAETGSLAMAFGPGRPRSVGLLPPSWVAIVPASRLVAGRPDLIRWMAAQARSGNPPAQIGVCSGPSRTGDIESILLTGVHGPGDVHAIIVHD